MQRTAIGREVYAFLADLGFRTTRGVWPLSPTECDRGPDDDCEMPEHLEWLLGIQAKGFEIGYHNARVHTSRRQDTIRALEKFRELFGHYPVTMANHFQNGEGLYWGNERLSGWRRTIYDAATRGQNRNRFFGHQPDHPLFWGDLAKERIRYVRNFVFRDVNTLAACPYMPYHDPIKPWVPLWYAATEGNNRDAFVESVREANQDRLEEEGGACLMYTHFGFGYVRDGVLDRRFRELMERLRKKNGWFVPVSTLLDFLRAKHDRDEITPWERTKLETRWLATKLRYGTS